MMDIHDGAFVLPIRPDWRINIGAEWSYLTNIFRAADGSESRRAQREKPRYRLEFTCSEGGERARQLRNALPRIVSKKCIVPDFCRSADISTDDEAVSMFPFEEVPYWIRTGRPVAFLSKEGFVIRNVVSTIDEIVTVDEAVPVEFQRKITAAVVGRVRSTVTDRPKTSSVSVVAFDFEEDPTTALDPLNPIVAEESEYYFRGYPVFDFNHNWSRDPEHQFSRKLDLLDFGYGAIGFDTPEVDSHWVGRITGFSRSAAEMDRLCEFFFRRKGQRGVFYCPTGMDDLSFVSVAEDRSRVTFKGTEPRDLFEGNLVYRNIALTSSATGMFFAGVKSVEIAGGDTVCVLDAELPVDFGAVSRSSWLFMARFASDQLSIAWETNTIAQYGLAVTSVIDRFYEMTIDGDRVMIAGDYLTFPPDLGEGILSVPILIGGEHLLLSGEYGT